MPTRIEWCDETFNPWWGCAEVSPGCGHCYARTWARFTRGKLALWPEHGQPSPEHGIMVTSDAYWREPLRWARELPEKLGRRPRVFCASMADVFEELPQLDEARFRLFDLIEQTPELDWLLLTKRPEFMRDFVLERLAWDLAYPLNVWLGVSIENARFTWRADVLREIDEHCPEIPKFVSAEPLIGSLFEERTAVRGSSRADHGGTPAAIRKDAADVRSSKKPLSLDGIDWVIIGGESGPGAREFDLEHAREILDHCGARDPHNESARPALFVKQLGAHPIYLDDLTIGVYKPKPLTLRDRKGGDIDEWPIDLQIREFPMSAAVTA